MKERWKPVVDFEDLYEVSDRGRVFSARKGEIISGSRAGNRGSPQVQLRTGRGGFRSKYVSHLVLEAFVGLRPPGMEACHAPDPDVQNNRLRNLRWDTHRSNVADSVKLGTHNLFKLGNKAQSSKRKET